MSDSIPLRQRSAGLFFIFMTVLLDVSARA